MALAQLPRNFRTIRETAQSQCEAISLGRLMRLSREGPREFQYMARFVQRQIPIRFARRLDQMLKLPYVVISNPHINRVFSAYMETFERVRGFPSIDTPEDEVAFAALIGEQLSRHNDGARLTAEGYRDVRRMCPEVRLDSFLHEHFTIRIATRVLMDSYMYMRAPRDGFVGIVCQGMRPVDLVERIEGGITELTRDIYGFTPMVEYRGNLDCVLDYIPRHVEYMLRELLKNAFRSTCERHLSKNDIWADVPHVVVELQQGDRHVIIKISDHGGGLPKSMQQEAWQYGWTTVKSPCTHEEVCGEDPRQPLQPSREGAADAAAAEQPESAPAEALAFPGQPGGLRSELAGYGFGLPLTRLHAQYFGGDVFMQSLPGHGTDMYIVLTHLEEGSPSTEIDDLGSALINKENSC